MAKKPHDDEPAEELVVDALAVLRTDLPDEDAEPLDGDVLERDDTPETVADIPSELKFTTKRKDADADRDSDVLEIDLDGDVLYARKPSKGAWSMVLGAVSRSANQADKTQAILEFVFASFDQPGQILIKNRMFDAHDDFDIDDLSEIVSRLIAKWAPAQSRADRRQALRVAGRR